MILGNPKRIDLGTSSFRRLREEDCLYVDKTRFIKHFLNEPNTAQLIVRQRRLGKSLNLDTLRLFLTDKEDNRDLFKDTYIKTCEVWEKLNSAPVFLFDFKNLNRKTYKEDIKEQVIRHIYQYTDINCLKGYMERRITRYMDGSADNTEGLLVLTDVIYHTTGKQSYILIDEYDKLLTSSYKTDAYDEIKEYETDFLSAGLKGNNNLAKALMTGVMRVSRESILSGLNNLHTYDLFSDRIYTDDFGFTEDEINALGEHYEFNKDTLRNWYNGVKINGKAIYNTYSVVSYLKNGKYNNYWGQSGTIESIIHLLTDERRDIIIRLLNGESTEMRILQRISLRELIKTRNNSIFYSYLIQAGYLSFENTKEDSVGIVKIPNIELMNVWKEFILTSIVEDDITIQTFFDNIDEPEFFSKNVEDYISDRLSVFDLSSKNQKTNEKLYHIFVLGILSAYRDSKYIKPPLSNRESGDGRYDILFERKDYRVIFEFKSVKRASELEKAAAEGLKQIDEKRYFAEIPNDKPLIKTAIAFCKKQCRVKSERYDN